MIGKKWIYLERKTLYRQSVGHLRRQERPQVWGCQVFKKIYLFNLFIFSCVGSSCCARAFSSCGERGLFFVAAHGLLIAVTSLVVEHGL